MKLKKQVIPLLFLVLFAITCKGDQPKPGEPVTPQDVYTKDEPGNWAGKENEHTPLVQVVSQSGKNNVAVTVTLLNPAENHFIEKIFIADATGRPWQEKLFVRKGMESSIDPQMLEQSNKIPGEVENVPGGKQYSAKFTIDVNVATSKKYKVYARCSQHDLWAAELK